MILRSIWWQNLQKTTNRWPTMSSKSQLATTCASEEVKKLEREIAQLEQEIVEHRRPATELNEDLKNYLGYGELQLAIKETGYEITRNGDPAQSLSEGETTAIALLYFLKSLDDRRFDSAKGVVVLDDPVSSLDANALFLAFGFIRERTQDSAQLFILTHNFTFFRNVKNWLHNMPRQRSPQVSRRPARLYMLEWHFATNTGQRLSTLRELDPLLEWYESEYHYLFARIYRESQKATTALTENLCASEYGPSPSGGVSGVPCAASVRGVVDETKECGLRRS